MQHQYVKHRVSCTIPMKFHFPKLVETFLKANIIQPSCEKSFLALPFHLCCGHIKSRQYSTGHKIQQFHFSKESQGLLENLSITILLTEQHNRM